MDLRKIGLFISISRKEKGLTQRELADKIGVSDKAVSKWETGRGFPDVSILKLLADILEVSITEIVNGETISPDCIEKKADNALAEVLSYSKSMARKSIGIIMLIFGIGSVAIPPLFMAQSGLSVFTIIGMAVLISGIILLCSKVTFFKAGALLLTKRFTGAVTIIIFAI
ncbi:MAG: helix-turn-helix domain-containing protein, partial [Oscillospiraceae bacterium]|nr:helix-turn-helix domain-containing protein [Oscillospiraceae bacterium]